MHTHTPQEYYSLKYQRYYYVHSYGDNGWDPPHAVSGAAAACSSAATGVLRGQKGVWGAVAWLGRKRDGRRI